MAYPTVEELRPLVIQGLEIDDAMLYEGGQRAVYTGAWDANSVVIKVMPIEGRERAEREVAIGHTFDHPNLARILDADLRELEVDGEPYVYFIEERIDGVSLAHRLESEGPLEACDAMRLARDLIAAVTYLWERHHVVHRDIKPLNIIRTDEGRFVLLDIGVGRHQDRSTLTRFAGPHQPGTEGHLAPEQLAPLKGREIDYRADLFAIGIVIYQALTGRLPFDPHRDSYRTLLVGGVVPGIDELAEPIAAFISRLLAPQPHNRYRLDKAQASAEAVMEELECL